MEEAHTKPLRRTVAGGGGTRGRRRRRRQKIQADKPGGGSWRRRRRRCRYRHSRPAAAAELPGRAAGALQPDRAQHLRPSALAQPSRRGARAGISGQGIFTGSSCLVAHGYEKLDVGDTMPEASTSTRNFRRFKCAPSAVAVMFSLVLRDGAAAGIGCQFWFGSLKCTFYAVHWPSHSTAAVGGGFRSAGFLCATHFRRRRYT